MLLISGFGDELCETRGELKIEWKVADFFALSQDEGCYYQSSAFSFARSKWNLEIFPGGHCMPDESSGYISFNLRACNLVEPPTSVSYTLAMKNAKGIPENVLEKKHCFDKNFPVSGIQKFYQRAELLRRQSELAPVGDLIIICIMKHDCVKTLEVTSPGMQLCELERLSMDFKELLSCKRSCDAVIKMKDKEFQVHKSVIIARSSVFESMFEHDMSEKNTGVVSIDDVDPDSFGEFLTYLYSGKVENLTFRNALHLYTTADKYDVQELKSFCVTYMMKNLAPKNMCAAVILAEQHDEDQLTSAAQVFFNRNFGRIVKTEEWIDLMGENPDLANNFLKGMAEKMKKV